MVTRAFAAAGDASDVRYPAFTSTGAAAMRR
jgi:hypothetical protein